MTEAVSLGVAAPHQPAFFRIEQPPLTDGSVLVHTMFSGLSAGTELTYVKGTDPAFTSGHDPESGVFVPGKPSRRYPVPVMGYMEVGEVVDSRRDDLPPGSLVAAAYGHRSSHVLSTRDHVVKLPQRLDPMLGIYLAQMGPIAANGLLHAAAEFSPQRNPPLGEGVKNKNVVVTGAGVVGLLSALFARRHGARSVLVVDPDPARLSLAAAMGLDTIDESRLQPWRWCKQEWVHTTHDRGADVVLQCRGRDTALHEALRCLRPQGVVIELAFHQGGAPSLKLGEEFHHNGLTIRGAQIARVPRGLSASWNRTRLSAETAQLLLVDGADILDCMITDVIPVHTAPQVIMELVRRQRSALQIVLDYR
jgi:threonine dehydrogenase-like Zn-dependent dehydrogenase